MYKVQVLDGEKWLNLILLTRKDNDVRVKFPLSYIQDDTYQRNSWKIRQAHILRANIKEGKDQIGTEETIKIGGGTAFTIIWVYVW